LGAGGWGDGSIRLPKGKKTCHLAVKRNTPKVKKDRLGAFLDARRMRGLDLE